MKQMRGFGSLQRVLGREFVRTQQRSSEEDGNCDREMSSEDLRKGDDDGDKPDVVCPVCSKPFLNSEDSVERRALHVEKCLSQEQLKKPKKQGTIGLYWQGARVGQQQESALPGPDVLDLTKDEQVSPKYKYKYDLNAFRKKKVEGEERSGTPSGSGNMKPVSSPPLSVSPFGSKASVQTVIVGRKYQVSSDVKKGDMFDVFPEDTNAYDKNALVVQKRVDAHDPISVHGDATLSHGEILGHLPRVLAAHLGPLIRSGDVYCSGIVLEDANENENILIRITIQGIQNMPLSPKILSPIRRACAGHLRRAQVSHLVDRVDDMLNIVERIERNALGESEMEFIKSFRELNQSQKLLFVKLSQRKNPVFRMSNLNVTEVSHPQYSINMLCESKFLRILSLDTRTRDQSDSIGQTRSQHDWEKIVGCLKNAEISQVLLCVLKKSRMDAFTFRDIHKNKLKTAKREVLLNYFSEVCCSRHADTRNALCESVYTTCGHIVEISSDILASFSRIQRLFFLNEAHSLSQWTAHDSGYVNYPSYSIIRSCSVYGSHSMYIQYEQALERANALMNAAERGHDTEVENMLEAVWEFLDNGSHALLCDNGCSKDTYPSFFQQYHAQALYCTMATVGVGFLERKKQYKGAIHRLKQLLAGIYCPERRGYWWIRLSIDLEHVGKPMDALEMSESGLADPAIHEDERLALQRRILRLGKPPRRVTMPSWADEAKREPTIVEIEGRPLENQRGEKSRFYGYDGTMCTVEQLALQYYASSNGGEYEGIHSEGGIWSTMFGLCMWPALFADCPNAFRTPFQTAPLDLGFPEFYKNRKGLVDNLIGKIRGGLAPEMMEETWNAHCGKLCRGISWNAWSLDQIKTIATCIGPSGMACVCTLFCQDYTSWRGGMPDLLVWNATRMDAKLVEVKGPRDSLSDKQRVWIAHLEDSNIPVEVLRVKLPKTRKRKT